MTRTGIDIDEAKVARNEFGLWLGWTLATALGMLLGFLPSLILINYLDLQWARVIVPLLAGTRGKTDHRDVNHNECSQC